MRSAATLGLAVVLCAAAARARPVALVLAADDAARKSLVPLLGSLHDDGGIATDDVLFPRDPGDVVDHALPRITRNDTLTVILAGRLGRDDAGEPALLAEQGAVPLTLLFARLAVIDAASCAVLVAPPYSPGPRLFDLLELWPRTRLPVAILESRHARFLAMLSQGLDTLRADTDADGLVSAAELGAFVQGRLGPDSARLSARPGEAAGSPVAGLGGPDVTPPLLLVTIPRLRDDAPVTLEQAAALRIRGIVADDRKVVGVVVNNRPAALTPADDPALEDLGYPERTHWFEAAVPLAQTGFTEVDLTATDAAGNRTQQAFMVLVTGPGEEVAPPEAATGTPDSIDSITPLWSQTEDWRFGFRLVVAATVHGRRGHPCRAQVQFRFRGGAPLKDYNGEFTDGGGHVAARAEFTPLYEHSAVQDIRVFMPQRELHLTPGQTHHLEMRVSLVDTTSQPPEVLAT
ncbi:MAG: hypothetical protein HYU66_18465, partial [Armatimonadetes bacterium]|nr:hypothetical protein [Armatimonadota bacterium]